jgi:hypothetical protein
MISDNAVVLSIADAFAREDIALGDGTLYDLTIPREDGCENLTEIWRSS